jgi:hypothetical protein
VQGHTITGNTLVSNRPSRRIVRPENLSHWWLPPYTEPDPVALEYDGPGDYGLMSHTTFVAPTSTSGVIRNDTTDVMFSTLGAWTADASPWASSAGSLIVRSNAILLFNDTEAAVSMPVPAGAWTRPDGSAVGSTVLLQPFRSVVLVTDGPAPSSPPYHAASGIDWRLQTPVITYLGDPSFIFFDGFESGGTAEWFDR